MNNLPSCFRIWTRFLGLLGLLVSCSGCFCFSTHALLQDARAGYREFDEGALTNALPLRGGFVGNLETNGSAYSCYQFTNALAGRRMRVLEIRVAGSKEATNSIIESSRPMFASRRQRRLAGATNFIIESSRPMAESAPAFLLLQGRVGNYSPEQYFSQYYPRENPRTYAGRAMYLCVYGDSLYALDLLREDPATGQLDWVRTDAKFQVAWQNRSRTGYALGHLGYYLFAVPLDIITFPYQLFVVLTLAH